METLSFLAIDLGTQSLRLSVADSAGQLLWGWSRPVDSMIEGDAFEQRSEQWADLLRAGLMALGRTGISVDAIAAAAPLAGFVALGQNGEPLTYAVMYPDKRSAPFLDSLEQAVAQSAGSNPYGLRAYTPDPIPHYLRIRQTQADVYRRMTWLLDATGWINWFLTGQATLNEYTALRLYDEPVRARLRVQASRFGRPLAIGQRIGLLSPELCQACGLKPIPVIAATIDSKAAYLGSGIAHVGQALDISGTVTSFGVVSQTGIIDTEKRVYSVPFGVDQFLIRGSTATAGGTLEWARKELLAADFPTIDLWVRSVTADVNGPIFLPYLAGERAPIWNPHARGALLGLTLDMSSRDRIARAVYEGLAFSLKHIVHTICQLGVAVEHIQVSGGLARNDVLCQIKADALGVPLTRYRNNELTSVGLFVIAGLALGAWADRSEAVAAYVRTESVFAPNAQIRPVYERLFTRYLEYSTALLGTFTPSDRGEA